MFVMLSAALDRPYQIPSPEEGPAARAKGSPSIGTGRCGPDCMTMAGRLGRGAE